MTFYIKSYREKYRMKIKTLGLVRELVLHVTNFPTYISYGTLLHRGHEFCRRSHSKRQSWWKTCKHWGSSMMFSRVLDKSSIQMEHWVSFFKTKSLDSILCSSDSLWKTWLEAPLDQDGGVWRKSGGGSGGISVLSLISLTLTDTKTDCCCWREESKANCWLISRAIFLPKYGDSGTCSSRRSPASWRGLKPRPRGLKRMRRDPKTVTAPVSCRINSSRLIWTVLVTHIKCLGRLDTLV